MRARRRRGVTLMELLIAVTLLSMLSVGILMALRVGLNAMDKSNSTLLENRRAMSTQRILRSQIEGLIPVQADCLPPGQPPQRVLFFQGEAQTMRFVSTYSLEEASRGRPQILELQVIPRDRGAGVRLIVNESLYTGPQSAGQSCIGLMPDPESGQLVARYGPVRARGNSFVLADRLAYCRFQYHFSEYGVPDRWLPEWNLMTLPRGIRVEMAELEPDPSSVPLLTLVAPVRVRRLPGLNYGD